MATPTERVNALSDALIRHEGRIGALEKMLGDVLDQLRDLNRRNEDLTRTSEVLKHQVAELVARRDEAARATEEIRRTNALLEREVADFKSRRDEWGRRLWSLFVPLVSAAFGAAVMYYLRR